MNDLIARLEKAAEGSRELSDEVLLACGWQRPNPLKSNWWVKPDGIPYASDRPDPANSLDDALRWVVPEGWTISRIGQDDSKKWHTELRRGYLTSYDLVVFGPKNLKAPTPALALCAAALKARAEKE